MRLVLVLVLATTACAKRAPSLGPNWTPYGSHGCITRDTVDEHTTCCHTQGKREYGGVDYVCVTRDPSGRVVLPKDGGR